MKDIKHEAMQPDTEKTDPTIKTPPPQNVPGGPGGDKGGQKFPTREEPGKSGTVRPSTPKSPASAPGQTYSR